MPSLTNSAGQPTGAVYGFAKAVRRMLRDVEPDRAAVVWDEGLPERRTLLQPQYKAQREEMPEELQRQIEPMREFLGLLGFSNVSLPGTEADDLMASYARAAEARGWETILATSDKDLFQRVSPSVRVYSTHKEKVASAGETASGGGFVLLGGDYVRGKWGVEPGQLGEVLSLIGDTSDNIPGVRGVGPKGAAALIREFGGLDGLYARLGEVKADSLRLKLEEAREQVFQNREMVRLDLDLPLPLALEELRIQPVVPGVLEAARRFGFKSLSKELEQEFGSSLSERPGAPAPQAARWTQPDLF